MNGSAWAFPATYTLLSLLLNYPEISDIFMCFPDTFGLSIYLKVIFRHNETKTFMDHRFREDGVCTPDHIRDDREERKWVHGGPKYQQMIEDFA